MRPPSPMSLSPAFLADLVVALHLAVVLYMFALTLLVPLAWLARRRHVDEQESRSWVQSPWLRVPHLAIFVYIAQNALRGDLCFLTALEEQLRQQAAGAGEERFSFVGRILHDVLFVGIPQDTLDGAYLVLFAITVAMWFLLPPRLSRVTPGRERKPAT